MTIFIATNNASTTLAGAITAGATTCALAPGTGANFPNPTGGQQFALTFIDAATGLNTEIVYVTARSGDTITTMVRAQEGTTAKAWLAGDLASNFYTQGQDAAKAQIPGVQNHTYTYAADTGAANAYAVALSPAPTLSQGAIIGFTAAHANTAASTLAVNGGTAYPIWGAAHQPLQGTEIALNGYVEVEYNPTLNSGNPVYLLLECTGGALQVATATQSQHAVQFGQLTGLIGSMRNAKMSVAAASATATFTADQIVVGTALNGLEYLLPSYSQSINLAATGAGGMDTGSAPVSGYVALYAIYKPSTNTTNILATNSTSAVPSTIYSGANMPVGYTASALIGIWGTDGTGKFRIGIQRERRVSCPFVSVLSGGTATTYTSTSLVAAIPQGAKSWTGNASVALTAAAASNGIFVAGDANDTGLQTAINPVGSSSNQSGGGLSNVPIITEQVMFYKNTVANATSTVTVSSYEF
jgi:hypothetical protein